MSQDGFLLRDWPCEVTENRCCGDGLYVIRFQPKGPGKNKNPFDCGAGQFVMIDMPAEHFLFRRPMSVLDVHPDGSMDVFYRVVGLGTTMMAAMQPGQVVNVLGPLGNTFKLPEDSDTALLIGGGIGIAPLYLLGKQLKAQGKPVPHCFYGARSESDLGLIPELEAVFGKEKLHIATDDGSGGVAGNVCDLLKQHPEKLKAAGHAYICGPTVMMRASANLLATENPAMAVAVSLEEHMPCGTGACSGCVVFRTDQELPSKVCVEGPVFDARAIQWEPQQRGDATPACGEVAPCPS